MQAIALVQCNQTEEHQTMRVLQEFYDSNFRTRFSWDCPADHWREQMAIRQMQAKPLSPESVALFFYQGQDWIYGGNLKHGKFDPLPRKDASKLTRYLEGVDHITLRLSVFILRICLREMRHGSFSDYFWAKFAVVPDSHDENERLRILAKELQDEPGLDKCSGYTVAEVCRVCEYMFRKGGWGSAFGGVKWAHIADTLHDFCKGVITPEIFCDRAFNLAHNTSPIFNKGGEFSPQNAPALLAVLDAQAKGQIAKYKGTVEPWGAQEVVKIKGVAPLLFPWTKEIVQ